MARIHNKYQFEYFALNLAQGATTGFKARKHQKVGQDALRFQGMLIGVLYNKMEFNNQEKQWRKMHGQVKNQGPIKQAKLAKKTKPDSSESDQFQLQYHQIKKLGLPVNKNKLRVGNWNPQENLIYLKFLQQNKMNFVSEQERRKNKVFYRLSKILKKRTPDQCRSHHQKLQMKYQDKIDQIIKSIHGKLYKKSPELFFEEQIKKVDMNNKKTDTVYEKADEVKIIDEGDFYKFLKKGDHQFCLQICLDQIKTWN